MNPYAGIAILFVLPPALMAIAHIYAVWAQDTKNRYVVLLDPRVHSAHKVAQDHRRRHRIIVDQIWDASTKGYSALIPRRRVDALTRDRRVLTVEPREPDEEWVV